MLVLAQAALAGDQAPRLTKREQELLAAKAAKQELEQLKKRHQKLASENRKLQMATKAGFLSSARYGLQPLPPQVTRVKRGASVNRGAVDIRARRPSPTPSESSG